MCLILLALKAHPRYPFILASNRDEFRDRRTQPARFWEDCPHVLAGRDCAGKGTWLGVTDQDRLACLTNVRDPGAFQADRPSRGGLVSGFLASDLTPLSFVDALQTEAYNPFNLILGSFEELFFFSSRQQELVGVESGIHGLSNDSLNTDWPKVVRGKALMARLLEREEIEPGALMDMLQDRSQPGDEELPDTGVGLELERFLAPIFICGQAYGTRSSTVILVDDQGLVRFRERTHDGLETKKGAPDSGAPVREFSFSL